MCFSAGWFQSVLIWLVLSCALIAIVKLLLPLALAKLPAEAQPGVSVVGQVLGVIVWAVVVIFAIIISFELFQCLLAYAGGLSFPRH